MKRILALAATLALVAACGSSTDSAGDHNDADVAFAQQMIPHHEQAVEMSQLAAKADTDPDVEALAEQIAGAQGPEISQMSGWLKQWSAPRDAGGGDMAMDGMMSGSQMSDLGSLSGDAFATEWLTLMIQHHEGAVDMARTELADGQYGDAQRLARSIITDQQSEISQMKEMLQ